MGIACTELTVPLHFNFNTQIEAQLQYCFRGCVCSLYLIYAGTLVSAGYVYVLHTILLHLY